MKCVGQSALKSRGVEETEARGIEKDVYFDDLPARNREAYDRNQPTSVVEANKSRGSIHDGWSDVGDARECERPFGHRTRTANYP